MEMDKGKPLPVSQRWSGADHPRSADHKRVEIDTYDPVAKNYPGISISSDGSFSQASFTMNGNVATWEGTSVVNGRRFKDRGTDAVAPDGMSFTTHGEIFRRSEKSCGAVLRVQSHQGQISGIPPVFRRGDGAWYGIALPHRRLRDSMPCSRVFFVLSRFCSQLS